MLLSLLMPIVLAATATAVTGTNTTDRRCRTQPGDPSFPSTQQLSQLNSTIEGRLVKVVPSGQFCKQRTGGCTDADWGNSVFRSNTPGAMDQVNWEQDYASKPPSLCSRNSSVCGQGSVPVYAVNATSAAHIQAGVRFAQQYNLKVAIKASGHDFLDRSTAKNSLLLWTRYMESITFHDSFRVGGKDEGSAVTVGSGVGLHEIYQASKGQGKTFVGGTAANVVAAGGYIQGGGHSALSPLLGLASDNALEFEIVTANGDIVTANEVSHSDLFWALRGGGAGSWGVIISATLRTFPTFDAVFHVAKISGNSSSAAARMATIHAQHIFDWDDLHAAQYFSLQPSPPTWTWTSTSVFPNSSIAAVNASIGSLLNATVSEGFIISNVSVNLVDFNDALTLTSSDPGGAYLAFGSRLVPADVYRHNATAVGETYQKLFDSDPPTAISGMLVAGGRVSQNAHIVSAVNPKWRTAKTHVVIGTGWDEDAPLSVVESLREDLTQKRVPILAALAGPGSGSYSNEADVREPEFQTTFFGPNYARLSVVKDTYDPEALFIVGGGVGSEKWDAEGLCKIV